ncbi:MAG: AAA family ATPase [Treponema sp.]|jgi:predicted ATPase|nr:AAA family ATPase [Treponema sp.]
MKIENIHIDNYKALKNVDIKNIGAFAVFLGENGTGKSTLFDVFGFMKQCLTENIRSALQARGGYDEVHTRDAEGDISFAFQYRIDEKSPLCTYELRIGLNEKKEPVIEREVLRYRRTGMEHGSPWKFVDFTRGSGEAITNEGAEMQNIQDADREKFVLDAPDILAIKSLGQMKRFRAAVEFRRLIEDWFVSDFKINAARQTQDISYTEQLNRNGDNIANVTQFLHDKHPDRYEKILDKMKQKIPGISSVESKQTEDGQILLRFSDDKFKNPFSARFVSDGTIKMFAYLVMLADPNPHKLLCIEEPENQLYPRLLGILAEEFREYAFSGGQVFISTHSPDFVNAVELDELFIIKKQNGYSTVDSVTKNKTVVSVYHQGDDKLGYLWQEDML